MAILCNSTPFRRQTDTVSNFFGSKVKALLSIPVEKYSCICPGKAVVYLQHGLLDSSDTFVINSERLAAGFYFANCGYDVWLGNTRGNKYSSPGLSPNAKDFWAFSFDEMARNDLPAAFEYISKKTDSKINYVGHSQGSLIMFAALAADCSSVRQNLLKFVAWAPVTSLAFIESTLFSRAAPFRLLEQFQAFGDRPMLLPSRRQSRLVSYACEANPILSGTIMEIVCQKKVSVNNVDRLPIIMGHFPAGTSLRNLVHYEQMVRTGKFKKFDTVQGKFKNSSGQADREYDLGKIQQEVNLFVGAYDRLTTIRDNQALLRKLQNCQKKNMQVFEYGHASFVWGLSTEHLERTLSIIES